MLSAGKTRGLMTGDKMSEDVVLAIKGGEVG